MSFSFLLVGDEEKFEVKSQIIRLLVPSIQETSSLLLCQLQGLVSSLAEAWSFLLEGELLSTFIVQYLNIPARSPEALNFLASFWTLITPGVGTTQEIQGRTRLHVF